MFALSRFGWMAGETSRRGMSSIGFIGLGNMGAHMVGCDILVFTIFNVGFNRQGTC